MAGVMRSIVNSIPVSYGNPRGIINERGGSYRKQGLNIVTCFKSTERPWNPGVCGPDLTYDVRFWAPRTLHWAPGHCEHVFPFMIPVESCICNRQGSLDKRESMLSIHK